MTDSITPAKLTKTFCRGVHSGWESQDGTMYAYRVETGEWEVRRSGSPLDYAVCYSLQHARVVIAEWIAERSPGELEYDLVCAPEQRESAARAWAHSKLNSGS